MEEPITYTKVPVPADVKYGIEITGDGYEFYMADGGFLRTIFSKKNLHSFEISRQTMFLVRRFGAVILNHNQITKDQPTKTVTMVDDCCEDIPPSPVDGCANLPIKEKWISETGRHSESNYKG